MGEKKKNLAAYCPPIKIFCTFLLLILGSNLCFGTSISSVENIQIRGIDANTTELQLVFKNKPSIRHLYLENPTHLVVDINNGRLRNPVSPALFTGTLIKAMHQGSQTHQVLRLIFEMNTEISMTSSRVEPSTIIFKLKAKTLSPPGTLTSVSSTKNTHSLPNSPALSTPPTTPHATALNFSVQEDSLLGPFAQVKSSFGFSENHAAAMELDGGARMARVNGTYGFALDDTNRIKLTAEYLLEDLDFSFYTGDTRQWVGQGAIGASYQYLLEGDTFKGLEIGSHYSHAPSKNLNDETIVYANGSTTTDYRRIAGGDDWNGTAETALHLWPQSLLTVGGDYDRVRYDIQYDIQDGQNSQGFGGHARLEQVVKPNVQFKAQSTVSQLFNTYGAGLDWIWRSTTATVLSLGLNSSYTQDHTTERNFWVNGVNINVTWGSPQNKEEKPHYNEPQIAAQTLGNWVQTPAVRMPDVLAISDERIVTTAPFTPVSGLCPSGNDLQYNNTYSAPGGWFQSYPQGIAANATYISLDSGNMMANPSGQIACLYKLVDSNFTYRGVVILENYIYKNAAGTGNNWVPGGKSQFWPSTEPTPFSSCIGSSPALCPFETAAP